MYICIYMYLNKCTHTQLPVYICIYLYVYTHAGTHTNCALRPSTRTPTETWTNFLQSTHPSLTTSLSLSFLLFLFTPLPPPRASLHFLHYLSLALFLSLCLPLSGFLSYLSFSLSLFLSLFFSPSIPPSYRPITELNQKKSYNACISVKWQNDKSCRYKDLHSDLLTSLRDGNIFRNWRAPKHKSLGCGWSSRFSFLSVFGWELLTWSHRTQALSRRVITSQILGTPGGFHQGTGL